MIPTGSAVELSASERGKQQQCGGNSSLHYVSHALARIRFLSFCELHREVPKVGQGEFSETIKLLHGMVHPTDDQATKMRSHSYAEEQGDLLSNSDSWSPVTVLRR